MKKILIMLLIGVGFGQPFATAKEWKLDPAHSNVLFDVRHIYSSVGGRFPDFNGKVYFDPENPEKSSCEFVVKVDSVDTANGKRDNHLRSDDFFAAKTYPEMTFKSGEVKHSAGNRYVLSGEMTIKDISKEMEVEFTYLGQKEHPFKKGQMVAGFETRLKIDRLGFNVGSGKFYKMGVVGKEVNIFISLEMTRGK